MDKYKIVSDIKSRYERGLVKLSEVVYARHLLTVQLSLNQKPEDRELLNEMNNFINKIKNK